MPDQRMFSTADVEIARQRLNDNRYGGPDDLHDLDRGDIHEIVQLVLTATWDRIYDEGLAEGRRLLAAEYDVKLGGDGSGTPPVEMVYGYNAGLAEGRRQATEGGRRRWGVWMPPGWYDDPDAPHLPHECSSEADAWSLAQRAGGRVAVRLVGPWEPDEQPEPLADDPVARRLGLVDAEGRTLCRCLAGSSDCPHRPASGGVVEPSGPLTAEEAEPAHESFTELPCNRDLGPHPRHTWSHRDEPCEGHVCPGERWLATGGVIKRTKTALTAEEATPDCGVPNNPGGIFRPGTCKLPSGHPGWHEDGGLSWLRDREELERVVERAEHAPARRQHDPGALIEEPDLYEQGGHLDGEFAAERGKFDPLIGEQGEGGTR